MKDLRDLKDLTIHNIKPISEEYSSGRAACILLFPANGEGVEILWFRVTVSGFGVWG